MRSFVPLAALVAVGLLTALGAPRASATKRPSMTREHAAMPTTCLEKLLVHRGESPWSGYTSSHDEEARGKHLEAVTFGPGLEIVERLRAFAPEGLPLLAIDRGKRAVVVERRALSPIERRDATRIAAGARERIGTASDRRLLDAPRRLALFLVSSQIVQTYWHLEAELCLTAEARTGSVYRATFAGVHRYCTNECHDDPLAFALEIDTVSGAMDLVGVAP